jgi:branched-chain amino acid transport system ATP-binding protein
MLKTIGLSKRFGALIAANNISMEIGSGEIVGIIGTNGAGKTTFVNMITGYSRPSSGQIWLGDEEVTGLRPMEIARRGVGRSFQVAQLFLGLSAFENLLVAAGIGCGSVLSPLRDPERIAACQELFNELGLASYQNQKIAAMPQGARKLLDIAMALAAAPKLLVLDEPTSGVSSQQKMEIMDRVIQAVAGNSMAVILIEHDMEIVERYVDRILAFAQGEVICEGRPDKVLNDPIVREKILGV